MFMFRANMSERATQDGLEALKEAANGTVTLPSVLELRLVSIAASLPGEVSAGSIGGLGSCLLSDRARSVGKGGGK